MTERVILAGWGGQGMISLGKLLATIMMGQGREVTCFPSYGAEVRGGAAQSQVVFSTEPIYSPIVERADALLLMNQPSYDALHARLDPRGLMILNASMVEREEPHPEARIVRLPATDVANKLGDVRVANVVMLGAYRAAKGFAPHDAVVEAIRHALGERKAALVAVNVQALACGEALARTP